MTTGFNIVSHFHAAAGCVPHRLAIADVNGEIAAIGNYVIVHSPNKEAGAQRWPDAWRAKLFTE